MGAWGRGSFENDDAADWVRALERDGAAALTAAFDAVTGLDADDYLEAPEATVAVAAAEILASARDGDVTGLPEEVRQALVMHRTEITGGDLLDSARAALRRVIQQSELRELWLETDDGPLWIADLERLLRRLG